MEPRQNAPPRATCLRSLSRSAGKSQLAGHNRKERKMVDEEKISTVPLAVFEAHEVGAARMLRAVLIGWVVSVAAMGAVVAAWSMG